MAERKTLARPYAEAVFQMAKARNQLDQWSGMLKAAAMVAADASVVAVASNPLIERDKVVGLFTDVLGKALDKDGANFIRLLLENHRLLLLPEISALFEGYKADEQGTVDAEVISAFPLDKTQAKAIRDGLKKRLGREVNLVSRTDENLIGGAVIRAGDLIIDGSIRGYLDELSVQLQR